jgi:hypothetical protein
LRYLLSVRYQRHTPDLPQWPTTRGMIYSLVAGENVEKEVGSYCFRRSWAWFGFEGAQVENSLLAPRSTECTGDDATALTREERAVKVGFLSLAAPKFQLHLAGILSKTRRTTGCAHQQFAWSRRVLGVVCWQNRPRFVISRWCSIVSPGSSRF